MNNPLLPGPRRVNWLGEEPEPDLSWFEEEMRKHLENAKRELQFLEGNMLKRRRLHAEVAIREFMLQQDDPTELIHKDLLKELKEVPVALIASDGSFQAYEQRCEEDPFWGPMQEASAFGKNPTPLSNLDFYKGSFSDYLNRMDNEPD